MNAVRVDDVTHRYGDRVALDRVSLEVKAGEIFSIVGPNGSGKTTLFRLLSTLATVQDGAVAVGGHTLPKDVSAVRRSLGVVFQAPSVDKKLTVAENFRHQAALYGMNRRACADRENELLVRFGIEGRRDDRVETLSGGLRRRLELAKALVHRPTLLLLDEPSTGLDPGARREMWNYLGEIRDRDGITVVATTHILEEAEKADRVAVFDGGRVVALDTPDALRATVGGDAIVIESDAPDALANAINEKFACDARIVDRLVRIEQTDGHTWIARLVEAFPGEIQSIRLSKPTLEDVFVDRCGRQFHVEADA
ncbi:MAG: ABC transporter ATP-binding protein [Pirellulales bacterium]|nr:ABC transporter ATP-binding protein [Pirellulales bacterium]